MTQEDIEAEVKDSGATACAPAEGACQHEGRLDALASNHWFGARWMGFGDDHGRGPACRTWPGLALCDHGDPYEPLHGPFGTLALGLQHTAPGK